MGYTKNTSKYNVGSDNPNNKRTSKQKPTRYNQQKTQNKSIQEPISNTNKNINKKRMNKNTTNKNVKILKV